MKPISDFPLVFEHRLLDAQSEAVLPLVGGNLPSKVVSFTNPAGSAGSFSDWFERALSKCDVGGGIVR